MEVEEGSLKEIKLLKPRVFEDGRGFFVESYNKKVFDEAIGASPLFVQDNRSRSSKGTLRGLHYQLQHVQGKLICPLAGILFDLAVDMREGSPTFGCWSAATLDARDKTMLWIPPGFAHGFLALTDGVELLYKTTDYYDPQSERCLRWDYDKAIPWPLEGEPLLSDKDKKGVFLEFAPPIIN